MVKHYVDYIDEILEGYTQEEKYIELIKIMKSDEKREQLAFFNDQIVKHIPETPAEKKAYEDYMNEIRRKNKTNNT